MRLLVLPRYGPLGASSRVRMYQYLPALQAAGVQITVSPLLDDAYVRALYQGRTAVTSILWGYARRVATQLASGGFNVAWVEKELLPWWPALGERLRGGVAVAVDYDDAVFHRYDQHPNPWVRRMLGDRIDRVMAGADLVTAGNRYLADRAKTAGCRRVEALPTVVDASRYAVRRPDLATDRPLRIGWIGSPATAGYLRMVAPAIESLSRTRAVDAIAIGARDDQVRGTPFHAVPWTEATEAEEVARFDIGIMPLPDAPWERGKCGYKLIQYMACGLPVVASPVGVNTEIVVPGENGLLAIDESQWYVALERLANAPELRVSMGQAGRRRVEAWYSLQAQAPRLVGMFQALARGGR